MNDDRHRITPDQKKRVLEINRRILYRIPSEYKYLSKILTDDIRTDLLSLYKWIDKVEIFRYEGKYTFILDNKKLTYQIRRKQTESVTSRHFNYLCAIGLLNKNNTDTEINKEFIKGNPEKRAINTYYIKEYTPEELERIDGRSKRLIESNVTSGNISNDKLKIVGLDDIAREVYPLNSNRSIENRLKEYVLMIDSIESEIALKGYVTKPELYYIFLDPEEIDKLFRLFKSEIQKKYSYKRPTAEEKAKYNLTADNWIITKREGI